MLHVFRHNKKKGHTVMPSIVREIDKKYYLILKIQVNNINSTATSISDTICSFTTTFNYLYYIFFTLMNFSVIFEFDLFIVENSIEHRKSSFYP